MIRISLQNSGGEIDFREVEAPVDVPEAISEMVIAAGELFGGDKVIITDTEDQS